MLISASDRLFDTCRTLIKMRRSRKALLIVSTDFLALTICIVGATLLGVTNLNEIKTDGYQPYLLIPGLSVAAFASFGLYNAVTRFIDRPLIIKIGSALAAVLALLYISSFYSGHRYVPPAVIIIYWFIAFFYLVASRLSAHFLLARHTHPRSAYGRTVAIYGADGAGVRLKESIQADGEYRPACFLDEKRLLRNQDVAGLQVFHTEDLPNVISRFGISMIVIAIPNAHMVRRREVMRAMQKVGVPVKLVRSFLDLADDKPTIRSVCDIEIEDLLGRPPVRPQTWLCRKCIHGKNILVTGAGGSIGSELCRQVCTLSSPLTLHLFDHSEFALYQIGEELRARFPQLTIKEHLGSVCDAGLVERIMRGGQIDTVYHAAAYKHVPLVESNIAEGLRNNVIGAKVITDVALKLGTESCVLISSDKAVRPTNIMGASKRIAELIFQGVAQRSEGRGTFCMVRLGNVLGSSGSVIPLFQRQIAECGPVTITHPDVHRYFMLTSEAAQLVIQAGAMAKGGEVFVLDMGSPIKILDLAKIMIAKAGLEEVDKTSERGGVEIRFIGLRPGEKLYEELLIGDNPSPTDHPRIMCATEYSLPNGLLEKLVEHLLAACNAGDADVIKSAVHAIVHEYAPQRPPGTAAAQTQLERPLASICKYKCIKTQMRAGALLVNSGRRAPIRKNSFRAVV